jgi:GntR family transcriptional repressor for pyruvate dehydrogenase complex
MGAFAADRPRIDRISAANQIALDLRAQILSQELAKGSRLPSEKELAVRYDVSPATVRGAIQALSTMSLVEARHGSGTYVTADGAALVESALSAVVQLEGIDLLSIIDLSEMVFQRAVTNGVTAADDVQLATLRSAAENFLPNGSAHAFAESLRAFHTELVGVSNNKLLIAISAFLIDSHISLAAELSHREPELWQKVAGQLARERVAIAEALGRRDAEAGQAAVTAYISRLSHLVQTHVLGR